MVYGILIGLHIIVCVGLIIIVLIQAGRGGGLAESFSGAESIFGTKTNAFLTKSTSVFAIIFFITCLSLAFVSKQRSQSLLEGKRLPAQVKKVETKTQPPLNSQAAPVKKVQDATAVSTTQPTSPAPSTQGTSLPAPSQPQEPAHK